MFVVYDNHCLLYLREFVASANSDPVRQCLCSASNLDFIIPWTRTMFGDKLFLLSVWNSLAESAISTKTLASFKHNPKTHLLTLHLLILSYVVWAGY